MSEIDGISRTARQETHEQDDAPVNEGASIPEMRGAGKAGDLAETATGKAAVRQVHGEARR